MTMPQSPERFPSPSRKTDASFLDRLNMGRLLQTFLTIIAGAIVAVIAWTVVERFLHIIVLLIISLVLAYLITPLVDRLQQSHIPRALVIAAIYLAVFGVVALIFVLFVPSLTTQLQGLSKSLPSLLNSKTGLQARLDEILKRVHISMSTKDLSNRLSSAVSAAGSTLLGSTLTIVTGVVQTATDILLTLAITFYFLLDGHAMHNRATRLLPSAMRERWFFIQATLDKVLGGYVRGQLLVALTVGLAAGLGCALLGVNYPLVIGLLAFLFELIPMIGPILGMIPAVLISLFQSPTPVVWVFVFFVVLQQIESNVIVPRVSGHAVGLHPLAALLALLVGVELGGIGAAFLAVPLAGVIWVLAVALYADATGQTELLVRRARRSSSGVGRRSARTAPAQPGALPADAPVAVKSEQLETISREQQHLIERFARDEAEQDVVEEVSPNEPPEKRAGPDDVKSSSVT